MNNLLLTKQTTGFTMITNKLLVATNISLKAKGLYIYLISKPNRWNFSVGRIIKEMQEGRDSIYRTMGELESVGLLLRRKLKKGGRWNGIAYYVSNVDDANVVTEFKGEKQERPTTPIDERKDKFRLKCLEVYNTKSGMTKTLGKRFFDYWTEKTIGEKRMRYELQDTFEISLRMDKFIENQKVYAQDRIDKKENKKRELTTKNT